MEHPKKKEHAILESLMNSVEVTVKDVEDHLRQIQPTSVPEERAVAIPVKTLCPSAEDATACSTPLEFESSLDDMDEASSSDERAEDCLYLEALFSNVLKSEDGGYVVSFTVGEDCVSQVAELLKCGNKLLSLVVMGKPATPGP